MIDVAKVFKVNLLADDISFVMRKKSSIASQHDIPRAIRIKFYDRKKRDHFVEAGKSMRVPRHAHVDERNGRNYIYVNEALTRHNEFIYGRARELKRKNVIKRTWCRRGKIFIQWGNFPPKLIERLKDFDEVK